jgi:hypothetical protein
VPTGVSRVDPALWNEIVASLRQSLRAIAARTGGVALLDDADVRDPLSRIRAAVLTVR